MILYVFNLIKYMFTNIYIGIFIIEKKSLTHKKLHFGLFSDIETRYYIIFIFLIFIRT